MSKPEILDRSEFIGTSSVRDGEVVVFSGATGTKVKSMNLSAEKLNEIVANYPKLNGHISNKQIHLTVKEKDAIVGMTNNISGHVSNAAIHVSTTDRANWDAKETEEGAQQKVNIAFSVANRHIQDKRIHINQSDRMNWDNKYTREEIDNRFARLQYDNIWKASVDSYDELFTTYPSPQKGWTVTCNEDNVTYRYDGNNWIPISANSIPLATIAIDGKMSKADKAKLETIEEHANHYVHPDNPNIRHVSDTEKVYWNAKAEDRLVTYQFNGLMSKEDKYKLDSIEDGATNFELPNELDPQIIKQNETHRFVTDREKTDWSNKANRNLASDSLDGLMSRYDKIKLNTIEVNANYYLHPEFHPPTIIKQDPNNRFVTDDQIATWNSKAKGVLATTTEHGMLSKEDKAKLDSIETGANNYHLPESLPPTIIQQDANNRFFTDQERENLNLKKNMSSFLVGTGIFNGTDGTIISHDFGNTSFAVSITPTTNPNGSIGEIWVKKTNTLVVVYCSGTGQNITFDYTLTYYN